MGMVVVGGQGRAPQKGVLFIGGFLVVALLLQNLSDPQQCFRDPPPAPLPSNRNAHRPHPLTHTPVYVAADFPVGLHNTWVWVNGA